MTPEELQNDMDCPKCGFRMRHTKLTMEDTSEFHIHECKHCGNGIKEFVESKDIINPTFTNEIRMPYWEEEYKKYETMDGRLWKRKGDEEPIQIDDEGNEVKW